MAGFIVLLVGKSGTGKTAICAELEEHFGWKQISSYTTRPKRSEEETGHTFVTEEEFDKLQNMCAYTKFANYRYCATQEQVDESDIYVIDPAGVKYFMSHYRGDKLVIPIYLEASSSTRYERMIGRGDSKYNAFRRLTHDQMAFRHFEKEAPIIIDAEDKLEKVVANIYQTVHMVMAIHEVRKDES